MSVGISIRLENRHHYQGHTHIQHFPKFLPIPTIIIIILTYTILFNLYKNPYDLGIIIIISIL